LSFLGLAEVETLTGVSSLNDSPYRSAGRSDGRRKILRLYIVLMVVLAGDASMRLYIVLFPSFNDEKNQLSTLYDFKARPEPNLFLTRWRI
jgi:hypothetical protein